MRYLQRLIDQSRRATENEEFSSTQGIADIEFIQYMNDAQDRIQSLISSASSNIFQKEKEIDVVANQEAYSLPEDSLLGNKVDLVEYSHSGLSRDYYHLKQGHLSERLSTDLATSPSFFIRRSGQLLLMPIPNDQGAKIRITYQYKLPRLNLREGVVGAVTLDTSARTITSLTVDTAQSFDESELELLEYITVVDKDGNQKMRRIPITDVDPTTGVVTVGASFTYESTESIAVGDYLVPGRDSTTHSQLSDLCERYLIAYTILKILKRDSSNDATEQAQELITMENDIVEQYSQPDTTVDLIPITDTQFMTDERLW